MKPLLAQAFGVTPEELQKRQTEGTLRDIFDAEKFASTFAEVVYAKGTGLWSSFTNTLPVADRMTREHGMRALQFIGGEAQEGFISFLQVLTTHLQNNEQLFRDMGRVIGGVMTEVGVALDEFFGGDTFAEFKSAVSELSNNKEAIKGVATTLVDFIRGLVELSLIHI